jgi:hypothetical protein
VILEDAGDDGPLIPGTIHDAAGEIIDVPPPVRVPFLGMRGGSRREPGSHAGAMLAGPLHAYRGFTTYELPWHARAADGLGRHQQPDPSREARASRFLGTAARQDG